MPAKNPYANIKITLKEEESEFLLDLLNESKFTRHELDIVDKIYGNLSNAMHKREMRIKRHHMDVREKLNNKTLSPEIIMRAKRDLENTPGVAELTKKMESTASALIKHTLSSDDTTKEKND